VEASREAGAEAVPVIQNVMLGNLVSELTELPDELTLRLGEEETIRLPSLAGAGYVWEADVDDEAVAAASKHFERADEAAVGRKTFSRNELLTLRGCSAGTTGIRLVQRRTWEKGVEPLATHTLTVNVVADGDEATERGGTK
jgi:predicted secreted protein